MKPGHTGSLSVIMCNYNHAHYIRDALQAILCQTFRPQEVIVVDDGSTDNSVAVIEEFTKRDPVVRLVRNERNRGTLFTVNRGLDLASSDYVYFASADDKVLPGLFEKSMRLLAQYPQAGLCCSDPASFDGHTGAVSENRLYLSDKPSYFSAENLPIVIRGGGTIAGHTSLIKRAALLEAGGLIPELRWHCDWFAVFVIAFRHGICYVPEPLATIRVLPYSYSAAGMREWSAQRTVLDHLLRLLTSPPYRDVLPRFKRAAVLTGFRAQIVRVALSNPAYWHCLSLALLWRTLWPEATRYLAPVTPPLVKRLYRRIHNRPRQNFKGALS